MASLDAFGSIEVAVSPKLLTAAVAAAILAGAPPGAVGAGATLGRDVAATCANCHGTDGRSRGVVPGLAGRNKDDLIRQVKDFRDGRRPATVMQQLARGYTDAEVEAAAAYFAAQPAH